MAWGYRAKNWSHSLPYNPTPVIVDPADNAAAKERIGKIEGDERFSLLPERDRSFISSVKEQIEKGRVPSAAQTSWIERVEKQLIPVDTEWWKPEEGDNTKKRLYAILHYSTTGYYSIEIGKMKADSSYMPDKSKWDAMWGNKFIGAGYKRWTAGPKHAIGDMISAKVGYAGHFTALVTNVAWRSGNKWGYNVTFIDVPADHMHYQYLTRPDIEVSEEDTKLLTRKKKKA